MRGFFYREPGTLLLATSGLLTTRIAERLEDLHRMRVLRRLPLRVPLHRQGELLGGWQVNRLNQAIFGMGQRLDAFA